MRLASSTIEFAVSSMENREWCMLYGVLSVGCWVLSVECDAEVEVEVSMAFRCHLMQVTLLEEKERSDERM